MSDMRFLRCPSCLKPVSVSEQASGPVICGFCKSEVPLQDTSRAPSPEVASPSATPRSFADYSTSNAPQSRQTKLCPFCSEEIMQTAIKCKHCGSMLDGSAAPSPSGQTNGSSDKRKKIILTRSSSSRLSDSYTPTPQTKKGLSFIHWLGIIVFGGVVCLIVFVKGNNGRTGLDVSGITTPDQGGMTKEQWKDKLSQHFNVVVNQIQALKTAPGMPWSAKTFQQIMGKPDRTQVLGDDTYWYYNCRDGEFQLVIGSIWLYKDTIFGAQINEY
jgi:hypothetical protein